MKRLTIKCIVFIMFGIANKNYVKRPDPNSYLDHLREYQGMLLGHI